MPVRTIAGTDLSYALVVFDDKGDERPEPDGTFLSETLGAARRRSGPPVTDVFFTSHGWQGDVPAAIDAIRSLDRAMAAQQADRAAAEKRPAASRRSSSACTGRACRSATSRLRPAGRPCSRPATSALRSRASTPGPRRIADTPRARAAIRTILDARAEASAPQRLRRRSLDAYATLSPSPASTRAAAPRHRAPTRKASIPPRSSPQSGGGAAKPATQLLGIGDTIQRPLPLAAAPALVLEDEGPRARRSARTAPTSCSLACRSRRRARAFI